MTIAACAIACACVVASVASGASSSVAVSVSVLPATSIDVSGCTAPATLGLGTLTASSTVKSATPCRVQFGANAPARLTMYQRDRSGRALTQVNAALDLRSGVPRFSAVDNIDANDIWVGGVRVTTAHPTPLKHTTNGGTSWTDVTPCTAMGGTIGHVVTWSTTEVSTIGSNKICRSSDTGSSWTSITLPLTSSGRVFNPPGTDVLWLTTTTAGKLLRSTDRGATWSTITTPATTSVLNVVGWNTQDAVMLTTVTAGDQLSVTSYSYATSDGGATWVRSTVDTIPVTTAPATTGTLSLLDRSTTSGRLIAMGTWAIGNQFTAYYSDDNGATWTPRAVHPLSGRLRHLGGSSWTGGNRMNPSSVSHDDGATWGTVTMGGDPTAFLYAISTERGGAAVAVGDGSSVYRTTDRGASWTSISPIYPAYLAVVPFTADNLAVVATDGSALTSSDGGVTLVPAAGCGGSGFANGVATGATAGVVVGSSGKICRTTDSGQTWQVVASGTAAHLSDVVRAERTGLLIAHGADTTTFRRSIDDGATWQAMSLPLVGAVGPVAIDDDASTIAISRASAGRLWISQDSGVTFASRDDGVTSGIPSLAVSPSGGRIVAGHYLTAGDNLNRLASSTDGGATWSMSQVNAGVGDVNVVEFSSETRLWTFVTGSARKVMVSDDGGSTFTTLATSPGGTELQVLDHHTVFTSGLGELLTSSRPIVSAPDVVSGTGLAGAGGAFGACLLATTNAAPSWPMTGACSTADAAAWRGFPADSAAPGATVATTPGGTATADLVFGLHAGTTLPAGSYVAHLAYEVVAP